MSKFAKAVALIVLALWGLAAMHCKLEALPGLGFLKMCCFVETQSSLPADCGGDACGAVEEAGYRPEERSVFAFQAVLLFTPPSAATEFPRPEPELAAGITGASPPEFLSIWQFSQRAARPPRAPSAAS